MMVVDEGWKKYWKAEREQMETMYNAPPLAADCIAVLVWHDGKATLVLMIFFLFQPAVELSQMQKISCCQQDQDHHHQSRSKEEDKEGQVNALKREYLYHGMLHT